MNPVLTKEELLMVTGENKDRRSATAEQIKRIEEKLSDFQKRITDASHISKVNAFIGTTYIEAEKAAKDESELIKIYHREMNRKTCAAGLRCMVADMPMHMRKFNSITT